MAWRERTDAGRFLSHYWLTDDVGGRDVSCEAEPRRKMRRAGYTEHQASKWMHMTQMSQRRLARIE